MNDDTIGISRRQALLGLGAVGVASAGAGIGTTAYFSDEETFADNQLTAGELDLFVHVDYSENQGDYAQWSTPPGTYIDGNSVGDGVEGDALRIEVDDLKPGDSGEGMLCFSVVDNPAYLWMCGELTANDENGQTEPEAIVDETGGDPGEGDGELADAMHVTLSYCTEGEEGYDIGEEIVSGSLGDVLAVLRAGVPLYGDGNPDAPVANRPSFEGVSAPMVEGEVNAAETCVCLHWEVPTEVGNEIQTDSVMFDFSFYAEQARHNDGTNNPCADESFSAPYINDDGNATQVDGTLRLDVDYGTDTVAYRVQMDDPDGGPKLSDPLNSVTNVWVPFDVDEDGTTDFQLQWYPGGGLPDDPFGSKTVAGGSWGSQNGLPTGASGTQVGEYVVFVVPRSLIDVGNDTYTVGAHMSAGGEAPYAAISTESATGEIVPSGAWTSSQYFLNASLQ